MACIKEKEMRKVLIRIKIIDIVKIKVTSNFQILFLEDTTLN